MNTGSGDRQCLRRPTFGVEGQRADLLTVQCDLHPSAASRGHTQCGIVLNTCSFFTHIMLAIHLPMQLLLRSRTSEDSKAYIALKEDNTFEFNYSLLSSTIPTGKYKIIGRQVHCYDNSEYELKYVFDVKGNTLSFNTLLSSKLPAFSEVKNASLFK